MSPFEAPVEIAGQEQETDSQGAGGDWPGVIQGADYLGEDKENTAHKADSSQGNASCRAQHNGKDSESRQLIVAFWFAVLGFC